MAFKTGLHDWALNYNLSLLIFYFGMVHSQIKSCNIHANKASLLRCFVRSGRCMNNDKNIFAFLILHFLLWANTDPQKSEICSNSRWEQYLSQKVFLVWFGLFLYFFHVKDGDRRKQTDKGYIFHRTYCKMRVKLRFISKIMTRITLYEANAHQCSFAMCTNNHEMIT